MICRERDSSEVFEWCLKTGHTDEELANCCVTLTLNKNNRGIVDFTLY